ncbi:hypothetical protein Q7267_03870 [Glaesserella parasuis]|uniref:hypothetical protein n=1 Tax=Glaesserella parasuis TaxID=738 RepID=UPI0003AC0349|nr:hypothetical protein [Glaesserella parasuis]EQA00286.1 putative membrane protein [Glaesserella parasuis str. Nagasaki]MDD2171936.1 hypothetical protein [Glaesserella parasuis]MDG6236825.1 hypothetical protein [Glaesserella parasuis]MDG6264931.1 hypothetical protein [Glaesserella parasuis]MDG6332666.1 hypothetical protein [Glaesserella parasuis]
MEVYLIISVIIFFIGFFNILPKRGFANAVVSSALGALLAPVLIVCVILFGIYNGLKK